MRFILSLFKKRQSNKPTIDYELEHLNYTEKMLLQSLNDEQRQAFYKWNDNRKRKKEN
jgi:hypothetical protein